MNNQQTLEKAAQVSNRTPEEQLVYWLFTSGDGMGAARVAYINPHRTDGRGSIKYTKGGREVMSSLKDAKSYRFSQYSSVFIKGGEVIATSRELDNGNNIQFTVNIFDEVQREQFRPLAELLEGGAMPWYDIDWGFYTKNAQHEKAFFEGQGKGLRE